MFRAAGVGDALAPEFSKLRCVAGLDIPMHRVPVLAKQTGLLRPSQCNVACALRSRNFQYSRQIVFGLRYILTAFSFFECSASPSNHSARINAGIARGLSE